jgi:hypothetical protein
MKPTAPARSVERQRLAEAIGRFHEGADDLDRIERAIAKITDDRIADRVAVGRAREGLKVARASQSSILVARALGEMYDQPDIATAEATLTACEAKLEDGRAALKTLEHERERVRSALGLVEMTLRRCVADAVAADPALAALRAEFERCRLRLSVLIGALLGAGVTTSRVAWEDSAFIPAADWVNALVALRSDADARLPGIPPEDGPDAGSRDGRKAAA